MNAHKNRSITIRVRKDEYEWMESAAKSENLSISSFLRRIIVNHLKEFYPKPKPPVPKWLLKLKQENDTV